MTLTVLITFFGPIGEAAATSPIGFGIDADGIAAQTSAGIKPDYGSIWIGPWTLASGWAGPDADLRYMKEAGVTPAIQFYYWGDDISPTCVESGCWSDLHDAQKTRASWNELAQQLGDHLTATMDGRPVLIFVETEFNKGGIEEYEPFDGYLAGMADFLDMTYPAATIVLAFGNWRSSNWVHFDQAAASSDMVGIQGLRGSTRNSQADMYGLYEALLAGVISLEETFPDHPIVITDLRVSSYPEPAYLSIQAAVIAEVVANLDTLKSHGVTALLYRSWGDIPTLDTANYFGVAERYWGLTNSIKAKPAAQVWIDAVKAERAAAGAPIGTSGATIEAESFVTKSTGGPVDDAPASGGKAWTVWSNGYIQQPIDVSAGTYDLSIRARGTTLSGVGPATIVTLGGERILAFHPSTSYGESTVRINGSGVLALRIAFTNDGRNSTDDRNLVLDRVVLQAVNLGPTAAFGSRVDGLVGVFDAAGSTDPDGDPLTYTWNHGDGSSGTGVRSTHIYAAAGRYDVSLIVHDGEHSSPPATAVVVVQPIGAPTASFTSATDGLAATLNAYCSYDPDGDPLTYTWAFGDGSIGTGEQSSHAYAVRGTYEVSLTVTDGEHASVTTQTLSVAPPNRAPTAAFSASMSGSIARLDAAASTDPDGDRLRYAWNFGDGGFAGGREAQHWYGAAGTYTVSLTVEDGALASTTRKTVTVAS